MRLIGLLWMPPEAMTYVQVGPKVIKVGYGQVGSLRRGGKDGRHRWQRTTRKDMGLDEINGVTRSGRDLQGSGDSPQGHCLAAAQG